jgi:hypothetical protein
MADFADRSLGVGYARALRRGQSYFLGQVVVGQASVVLQRVQDSDIGLIHARIFQNLAVKCVSGA